ncbi:MAG: response regulator, partial [Candidatus Sericytochromatia bacterium]|nr:response regulator [Candidatus Sericytochromatia bacterium]
VVLDDSAVGPVYRAGYERALAGENVLFEQAMVYGGLTITLELTFNPIRSGSGVRGVWAFSKDITARKQTEAALLREKEVAEAATRAKAEFLAIMSHEIRTPLHAVLGLAGLLLDTPLSAEQRDYAETLEGSAATLSTILNDILDYSKLEVGKLTVHAEPFDVEALVADVAEMMAMRADEKGLDVVLHLDPGLPSRLIADSSRIKQVLLNLLSNAIKFTDAGSVMLDVRGAWLDGGICRVTFAVRDTGIGIPPHKQGLLFQKFTQADSSTTRRFGGTGLGLAISQELVELMGGELAMTSQEGIGSIFVFTLTLVTAGSPAEVRAQPPVLAGHTVLMLSANPWRVESFAGYFQLWGLAHHAAATLDEALDRLARGGTPGIILVDWAFYERYGGEVLARLAMVADLSVSLPLLLVPLRRRHARQADARAFAGSVAFPIRPALLRQHLLTMLGLTPAAPATLATPVRMAAGAPPPLRHPYRVLVVDDNAVNLKVACRMLERLGCMVDMVMTGQEAIDRVPVARYDLIFMDCQMPELDGYQTTRAIRALAAGGRVPIVAITAYALPGDRAKCLAAGMNDYLSKPIQREGLHMMLERWARVPRAVGTAAVPVIDRERLRDLVDDDEELLADIVTAYLEAVPGWCAELSRHAAAADLPLLGRAVHKVKGTLLNVAATTATAVARDLEEAARAGDADQANALLPVLQAQLLEVGTALAALTIAAVV